MWRYIARRLLALIPVLFGVSTLVFLIIHMTPGDPVRIMAGQEASPEVLQAIRHDLGLDQPLVVQYLAFWRKTLQGDLGRSFKSNRPVAGEIASRVPNTLQLASAAMVAALALGVFLGIVSAHYRGSWFDTLSMVGAALGVSLPSFWIALLLMMAFCLKLRLLPASGTGSLRHLVLPATTLALGTAAVLARLTRATMLEVLRQDYIRTAHAKGVSRRAVLLKHALRNSMIPVVTMAGVQFGDLLANTTIVETVFAWPGVSRLGVQAIWTRDYPVIQGVVLVVAVMFVLVNLGVDILYAFLDPRIRYE